MATLRGSRLWQLLRPVWLTAAAALLVETASCTGFLPEVGAAESTELALRPVPLEEPAWEPSTVAWGGLPRVAEPLWTDYALGEALLWGRDNQSLNQPLITTVDGNVPLVTTRDLQFPVAAGVRTFYGQRSPDQGGWEIGYFGIYGMSASRTLAAAGTNYIQVPEAIGTDLTSNGETATLKYNSLINSAEANLFRTWQDWRPATSSWLTLDLLAGFRYVGVEETAAINMDCCLPDKVEVPYTVHTRNNLFGGQVGSRARWTWNRWALEGWAKAGLFGNVEKQYQDALVDYQFVQQREPRWANGSEVAFLADLNISAVYRLTDVWGIRVGYSTVWIDGLALAPSQFDFANSTVAGTQLRGGDAIFLSGANLGLEARW